MSTRFFTNHGEQTLLRKFQGVFESNTDIEWFDALVGFLRASGYFAIRPFLGNVPHIRILVGINVDGLDETERAKCVAARAGNCGAWESEINDRVYRLYGLTKDEI